MLQNWRCHTNERQDGQQGFETNATITDPLNGLFSWTTWVSRYQKGKTSLRLSEARDGGDFGMEVASAGPYANSLHLTLNK